MVFQFYFKKMESSEALKLLTQKKLSDIVERFMGETGLIRVTFLTEKNEQKIQCHVQGWNGTLLHASGSCENMYATVDLIAQKLEAQMSRKKMRSRRQSRIPELRRDFIRLVGTDKVEEATPAVEEWTDEPEYLPTPGLRYHY